MLRPVIIENIKQNPTSSHILYSKLPYGNIYKDIAGLDIINMKTNCEDAVNLIRNQHDNKETKIINGVKAVNDKERENIEELLKKFFDAEKAKEASEDIEKGEQILRKNPAPEPDEEIILVVKSKAAGVILEKKAKNFRRTVYKTAAIAAAIIVITAVSVKMLEKEIASPEGVAPIAETTTTIQKTNDIFGDDAEIETLAAEVEQIQNELLALQLGSTNGNGENDIIEVEMNLMDIGSDFWKG
jgi:hypothetical protein